MLPYKDIQENPERKWHRQLLDRLIAPEVGEDELYNVADCLERLNDYRTVQPLLGVVLDDRFANPVRERAIYVLANITDAIPPLLYRTWFTSSDRILQDAAFTLADWTDTDLILPIANDPAHPRHRDAIGKLEWFERPEYQKIVINALRHPDPEVRERSADTLLWDEPLAALEPLLDLTGDGVPDVVQAACNTLQYYPTQRVYRCMKDIAAAHVDAKVRSQAEDSLYEIRWGLLRAIDDDARRAHLRRWLDPIWDELEVTEEEMTPSEKGSPRPPKEPTLHLSPAEIEAFLDDPDTAPEKIGDFFREVDWLAIPETERDALAKKIVAHPDHVTREYATMAFEKWQHIDGLIGLFHDSKFIVRKSATYHLGQLTRPSRKVATMLWDHLDHPDTWGIHSSETLDAYAAHASRDEARERLIAMAKDRTRTERLRYHAVCNLQKRNEDEAIQSLLYLVQEPPSVTWGFHAILLDAALELNLKPPSLKQYLEVDHAHIQTAIAPFVD
jgi:HEAT repeat protein